MFTRKPLGLQRAFGFLRQVFYAPLAAKCSTDFSQIPAVCLQKSSPSFQHDASLFLYCFYYISSNYDSSISLNILCILKK